MKKYVYERISRLTEQKNQLQEQLNQVTGGEVYHRLLTLEKSEKELKKYLQQEKQARQGLLKDVERLEKEKIKLQRKANRFNAVKDELEVKDHTIENLNSQLEAAWREIERQNANQTSDYLSVV